MRESIEPRGGDVARGAVSKSQLARVRQYVPAAQITDPGMDMCERVSEAEADGGGR